MSCGFLSREAVHEDFFDIIDDLLTVERILNLFSESKLCEITLENLNVKDLVVSSDHFADFQHAGLHFRLVFFRVVRIRFGRVLQLTVLFFRIRLFNRAQLS